MKAFIQSTAPGKPMRPVADILKIIPRRNQDYATVHTKDHKTYRISWETYQGLINEEIKHGGQP